MATSLGSLVVSLGLNAAEFTTGLTKSERDAEKFAKKLDQAIAAGATAAAGAIAAMGAAAIGAFAAINNLAGQAGDFKDFEEITGANAEALASFAVAGKTAGADTATLAGALNKLTKGLVTTEDETKDAGAALAALGLPIKEFKALDPATQLETVAKALAGFEDGASKTAVAMALFGKSGAALLPFLKELAAEGGRQVILTQQQIERADAYSDAQKRTRAQLELYLQALATEALPTITSIITATKEFVAQLIGVSTQAKNLDGEQIRKFAETGALALAKLVDAGDGVVRVFQAVGLSIAAGLAARNEAMSGNLSGARAIIGEFQSDIKRLLEKPLFSATLEREFDKARTLRNQAALEDRNFKPPGKQLSFSGKEGPDKKAEITDAEKLIASLEKQLEKMQDLTVLEQVELDLSKAKFTGLTAERQAAIELLAVRIQDAEIAKKVEADRKKLEEEASRIREQNSKTRTKELEAEQKTAQGIRDSNKQLEEQIAFVKGGEEAVRKLTLAKIDALIVEAKDKAFALANIENTEAQVAVLNEQIAALEKRKQLVGDLAFAEQLKKEAEALQEVKNAFSNAFADSFLEFIEGTKSAKDAFKSFVDDILKQATRVAAQNIGNMIFGGNQTAGPDFFGVLAKLAMGFLGGGGTSYLSVVDPVPGGFGGFASGTSFAPGGRAWVGENGPELVDLPRGAKVYSAQMSQRMAGSGGNTFITNVLPGADTRSARQAGNALRGVVMRTLKD